MFHAPLLLVEAFILFAFHCITFFFWFFPLLLIINFLHLFSIIVTKIFLGIRIADLIRIIINYKSDLTNVTILDLRFFSCSLFYFLLLYSNDFRTLDHAIS